MRILVIEDEPKIARAIKQGLELKGYVVDSVYDGDDGLAYAKDSVYDLIVLDRMLPGSKDGVEICKILREEKNSVPIIMLTARGTLGDKVEGLNAGADDYLVKPFAFDELIARVRALLRRPKQNINNKLDVGPLSLDSLNYTVTRDNKIINLTHKEFMLLEYLMRHPKQVVTKEMIIDHVWNEESDILLNTVEVYIGYLRKKLEDQDQFKNSEPIIKTKRGFGYILDC
jgi:DNA-binding response OmpR family regulator